MADGNAAPVRAIAGQKALLARSTHGIAYDAVHDVFMVPNFYAQAIQVYRGDADGEAAPIRIIQGRKTGLRNPDKLMLDEVNNEILIPLRDRVLVFDGNGEGDIAPKRILGPRPNLGALVVAPDAAHDLLVLGGPGGNPGHQFQVFERTASGNDEPLRVIRGPNAGIQRLMGPIAVQPTRNLIVAGVRTLAELGGDDNYVGVWDLFADGDVPPLYRLGGPGVLLQQVRGLILNPKHKEIIVTDKRINAVITWYFPEIF